jgi:hypothetical protein
MLVIPTSDVIRLGCIMGYARRTQISLRLPASLLNELDRRARVSRQSRSDVIRDILEGHLRVSRSGTPADHPYGRVRDLVGSVAGGPIDLGRRSREYLVELVRDRRG